MKRVAILGLGYIGLPTAILAAEAGYSVLGFDIDKEKIKAINSGNAPILEPEIQTRLVHVLKNKHFDASSQLEYADCFVITVPTPFQKDKKADLSYVFSAIKEVSKKLMPGNLIIIESTIPVGTTEKLYRYLEEISGLTAKKDFFFAHCPERAIPGKLFKELVENDRIIGGICQKSSELAYLFYAKFVKGYLHSTSEKAAEMIKLVENSSRDVQIAFANQVAGMCKQADIDPYHVIELANRHPRVNILSPTCGVGGHCIAIDPWFLIETFPENTKLLQTARNINDGKPDLVIKTLMQKIDELKNLGNKKPVVLGLGLTFKPDVDDIRESPALLIAKKLLDKKNILDFVAYDPHLDQNVVPSVPLTTDVKETLKQTDVILILVKHKKFMELAEDSFCNKIVVDTCGLMHDVQKQHARNRFHGGKQTDCNFENVSP